MDGFWIESFIWFLLWYYDVVLVWFFLEDIELVYGKVLVEGKFVIIVDFLKKEYVFLFEKVLIEKGVRSLLLVFIFDDDGRIISIFELVFL